MKKKLFSSISDFEHFLHTFISGRCSGVSLWLLSGLQLVQTLLLHLQSLLEFSACFPVITLHPLIALLSELARSHRCQRSDGATVLIEVQVKTSACHCFCSAEGPSLYTSAYFYTRLSTDWLLYFFSLCCFYNVFLSFLLCY